MGASMPLLSGLPGGQLLGGFSAAGGLGLQQGQHMYNGQLTQPAAYAALPGQLPYQVRACCALFVPFYLLPQRCQVISTVYWNGCQPD